MTAPQDILRDAGLPPAPAERLHGGDISQVWRCGEWVVKTHPNPPSGLFPTEATGLRTLADAHIRVPDVQWQSETGLVLTWLPPGPPNWDDLAEQVARMHQLEGPSYGSTHSIFLGQAHLPAGTGSQWGRVFADTRLRPLFDRTRATLGPIATPLGKFIDHIAVNRRLPEEGPRLVHGDLWHGNIHMSATGAALIDPSTWYAERGLDLAMMMLFGGFNQRFWDTYEALHPIPGDVRDAVEVYQLYYLLAHVVFFWCPIRLTHRNNPQAVDLRRRLSRCRGSG